MENSKITFGCTRTVVAIAMTLVSSCTLLFEEAPSTQDSGMAVDASTVDVNPLSPDAETTTGVGDLTIDWVAGEGQSGGDIHPLFAKLLFSSTGQSQLVGTYSGEMLVPLALEALVFPATGTNIGFVNLDLQSGQVAGGQSFPQDAAFAGGDFSINGGGELGSARAIVGSYQGLRNFCVPFAENCSVVSLANTQSGMLVVLNPTTVGRYSTIFTAEDSGQGKDTEIADVVLLSNGGAVVTGTFVDSVRVRPLSPPSEGLRIEYKNEGAKKNLFVATTNVEGKLVTSVVPKAGSGESVGAGLERSDGTNMVVVSVFDGDLKLPDQSYTSLSGGILVQKYTQGLATLWARTFETNLKDGLVATERLADGSVLIAGQFTEELKDSEGGVLLRSYPAVTSSFLMQIGSTGSLDWVRELGTSHGSSKPKAIAVSGNTIFVTGSFTGDLELATKTLTANGAGTDAFILRLDLLGTITGGTKFGTSAAREEGFAIHSASGGEEDGAIVSVELGTSLMVDGHILQSGTSVIRLH